MQTDLFLLTYELSDGAAVLSQWANKQRRQTSNDPIILHKEKSNQTASSSRKYGR